MHRGEVCAVDISTGSLRWKSDLVVISNVVTSKDAVFVLVEEGDLLALNPTNGDVIPELSVSFENKPFIPSSARSTSGNFFLAYDARNKIILIYLGDSRQLFAIQIN
jgi:outer membrane protein assembly factor BamB